MRNDKIDGIFEFNESLQDICGPSEKEFIVDHSNKTKSKYILQVGDECIVAPLSLFHTELLNITGPGKLAKVQKPARQQPDPEDCFDAEYLRETGVRHFNSIKTNQFRLKFPTLICSAKEPENNWIKIHPKLVV